MAKPLIKWAGGKAQLLSKILCELPEFIKNSKPYIYVEPFLGSGALAFSLLDSKNPPEFSILNDINPELINLYKVIKEEPENLINQLKTIQKEYDRLITKEEKKPYFYKKRKAFTKNQR